MGIDLASIPPNPSHLPGAHSEVRIELCWWFQFQHREPTILDLEVGHAIVLLTDTRYKESLVFAGELLGICFGRCADFELGEVLQKRFRCSLSDQPVTSQDNPQNGGHNTQRNNHF